jgi:hypothetical protein
MLWIFDEALLGDGSISLLRQGIIRSDLWKCVAAGISGAVGAKQS